MLVRLVTAFWLACAMGLMARDAYTEAIEINLEEGAIDVRTNGAPLASVLERIKQATGIELVFEGSPPRQLVRAQFRRPTIAAAIIDLMQGQSLSYAMQLDETGKKPLKLIVFTNVSRAAPSSPSRFRPSAPRPGPVWEEPPEMEPPEGELPLEVEPPEGMVEAEPAEPPELTPEEQEEAPQPSTPTSPFINVPIGPRAKPAKQPAE